MTTAQAIEQFADDAGRVFERYRRAWRGRMLVLALMIAGIVLILATPTVGAVYGWPILAGAGLFVVGFALNGRIDRVLERGRR